MGGQINQRARENQDDRLPPEFRLIQWEMSPAEMRDFYEQASDDTRRRLEAETSLPQTLQNYYEQAERDMRRQAIAEQASFAANVEAIRQAVTEMRSEIPRAFGQELIDGYYIVKAAPEPDAVGAVVRVKNGRIQNQRDADVASLMIRGFVFERVHVLDDTEYRRLFKEDGRLPFYEDLPDLPDNQGLRHCAHCGRPACLGKVFEGSRTAHKGFKWYVRCIGCGGGNEGFIKKEDAAAWWNHRDQRVVNPPLVIIGKKAEIKLGGNHAD